MAFTTQDLLEGLRASRQFFLKHLDGLAEEQWAWKPYAECKSIRETLPHLLADDRAALQSLETGSEPDYIGLVEQAAKETQGKDIGELRSMLDKSHERLCAFIADRYANAPMDTEVSAYGAKRKLGRGIAYLSSEDFYHAGQVAYIRMATDPSWDYYGVIYGGE
jgi:uncharacterized damage-inducible protein DinB